MYKKNKLVCVAIWNIYYFVQVENGVKIIFLSLITG